MRLQFGGYANEMMYVFICLGVVLLIVLICYMLYYSNQYTMHCTNLITAPVDANPMTGEYIVVESTRLPVLSNGTTISVSFWVYVDNIDDKPEMDHKIIMFQGNSCSYENGTWYVYMDSNTNRIYVSVNTTGVDPAYAQDKPLTLRLINSNRYMLTSAIDYVPLQRWVHITFSIRDAILSLYLDGDLYSVATIYDLPNRPGNIRPIINMVEGNIMIGGRADTFGVTGYLANIEYCNYPMTLQQVKDKYNFGPYKKQLIDTSYLQNLKSLSFQNPIKQNPADPCNVCEPPPPPPPPPPKPPATCAPVCNKA